MVSENPKSVSIYVTGFKMFRGVSDNPTETIVNQLKNYAEKKGLPSAGEGALPELYKVMESGIILKGTNSIADTFFIVCHIPEFLKYCLQLDLGVNSGAIKFAIEQLAANEATFQCPDEHGWKPQQFPIIPEDGGISKTRKVLVVGCCEEIFIERRLRPWFRWESRWGLVH
ncbi:cysteine protease [Lithospermum erythrorhizon]|uniref:Cysteine protease n=1 Tax=Lithospermum erythrorhizon TaxID=34254 RepID=A0AAV3R8V5_LITER